MVFFSSFTLVPGALLFVFLVLLSFFALSHTRLKVHSGLLHWQTSACHDVRSRGVTDSELRLFLVGSYIGLHRQI